MVSFVYEGIFVTVSKATDKANGLLKNATFLNRIDQIGKFDLSKSSGRDITTLFNQSLSVQIKTYKSWNPCTSACGKSLKDGVIYLNERRLDRPLESLVNTIVHELIHVLDTEKEFGHGGNRSKGKEYTAPYNIGDFAEAFLSDPASWPKKRAIPK